MADSIKQIAQNRKARHDYFIHETFEAGLALTGTEIKSLRAGNVNLKDSYVTVQGAEAFVRGMHVSPYEKGNIFNKDPLRERKLLLHKREILKLLDQSRQKGFSIIPLSVYLKGPRAKLQIALAQGKKLYDKRGDDAERAAARNIDRALKESARTE
jgi:SsrA-binding protein